MNFDRTIIRMARILSTIFRPFYLPVVGFIALFACTYLRLLPLAYKGEVLLLIYAYTILTPQITIFAYRKLKGWQRLHLNHRENRSVPYIISIISYMACLYTLESLHMPRYMGGIIMGALLIQVSCALINIFWKISTHAAGAGGAIGALLAFSLIFMFNPVMWLCLALLIAGAVDSSRMILRQHSLGQVLAGTLVGTICGFWGILLPVPVFFGL